VLFAEFIAFIFTFKNRMLYMRKLIYLVAFCLLFPGLSLLYGQTTGRYDVRFVVNSIDCTAGVLTVDLQVRASDDDSTFYMGDQNYKFTYNRQAIDLTTSVTELGFSGQKKIDPNNPNSLFQPYGPHNMIKIDPGSGSIALGILNIVWQPGRNGILVEDTGWAPVSRLTFNIVDPGQTQCLNLVWRDQSNANHFTNITEVEPTPPPGSASTQPFTTTADATEQLYGSIASCLDQLCNPLFPVEWTGFDVVYNGDFAEVNWSTAQEINNDYFVVERSTDGNSFREIGQVEAKGSNNEYRFDDLTVNAAGVSRMYYRVRQVDIDGQSSTTDVVELVLDGALGLDGVFPNPANKFVNLKLNAIDIDSITITISDAAGRVVLREERMVDQQHEIKVDVSQLGIGFYVVRVHDGVSSASSRFHIMR
jgi:hypothetical protein